MLLRAPVGFCLFLVLYVYLKKPSEFKYWKIADEPEIRKIISGFFDLNQTPEQENSIICVYPGLFMILLQN